MKKLVYLCEALSTKALRTMSPFVSLKKVRTVWFEDDTGRTRLHLLTDIHFKKLNYAFEQMEAKAKRMAVLKEYWEDLYKKQAKAFEQIEANEKDAATPWDWNLMEQRMRSPKSHLNVLFEKNPPCLTHRYSGGPGGNGTGKSAR